MLNLVLLVLVLLIAKPGFVMLEGTWCCELLNAKQNARPRLISKDRETPKNRETPLHVCTRLLYNVTSRACITM